MNPGARAFSDLEPVVVDDAMTIYEYFAKTQSPQASLASADLTGLHPRRVNHRSTKLYFVVSGELRAVFDDGSDHMVGPQGAILVPPGVWAELHGKNARVLIVCAPAYDAVDESIEDREVS